MTHVAIIAGILARGHPVSIGELVAQSRVPVRSIYVVLHMLEASGAIKRSGSKGRRVYQVIDEAAIRERMGECPRGGHHPAQVRPLKADFGPLLDCMRGLLA